MRLVGLILVFLLGGVVTAYTPVSDYVPPKDQLLTSVRNAAPFLADWLPDIAVNGPGNPSETQLTQDTATTQRADTLDGLESAASEPAASAPLWTALTDEDVESLLTELQLPHAKVTLETGESYIAVERDEAFRFYLRPRRCDLAEACAGLQIFSTFAADLPREQLAALNESYALVKFYMDMDGFLVLETHVSTDHGVSPDHVRANIEMFVGVLDAFTDDLQPLDDADGLDDEGPEIDTPS